MPQRTVHHGDALEWLRGCGRLEGASVVTSLPDVSELPGVDLENWRTWFGEAAELTMQAVPDDGVAIFFQSDVWHRGAWIDKSALVTRAADAAGMSMAFHKIVCRLPPGTVSPGRASYAHMLAFARTQRRPPRSADVIADGGFRAGHKAMGVNACVEACDYVRTTTAAHTVIDPFCGFGTTLAVANAMGMDAVGIDTSARMCRRARTLRIELPT